MVPCVTNPVICIANHHWKWGQWNLIFRVERSSLQEFQLASSEWVRHKPAHASLSPLKGDWILRAMSVSSTEFQNLWNIFHWKVRQFYIRILNKQLISPIFFKLFFIHSADIFINDRLLKCYIKIILFLTHAFQQNPSFWKTALSEFEMLEKTVYISIYIYVPTKEEINSSA